MISPSDDRYPGWRWVETRYISGDEGSRVALEPSGEVAVLHLSGREAGFVEVRIPTGILYEIWLQCADQIRKKKK
jgi:hypothetical protein